MRKALLGWLHTYRSTLRFPCGRSQDRGHLAAGKVVEPGYEFLGGLVGRGGIDDPVHPQVGDTHTPGGSWSSFTQERAAAFTLEALCQTTLHGPQGLAE